MSNPWRSLNGCGLNRETQSIAFLRAPGMEALYSGDATTKASASSKRRRNSSAPAGKPSDDWTSPSYDGAWNSAIEARSTSPPFASTVVAASRASREFSDSDRSDAENTRTRTGSRVRPSLTGGPACRDCAIAGCRKDLVGEARGVVGHVALLVDRDTRWRAPETSHVPHAFVGVPQRRPARRARPRRAASEHGSARCSLSPSDERTSPITGTITRACGRLRRHESVTAEVLMSGSAAVPPGRARKR